MVAYSGGVDSTALLHGLSQLGVPLHAVHVNHNLQTVSGSWVQHCEVQCMQWGIPFTALNVTVTGNTDGLEGEARIARYRAIFQWMKTQGLDVLVCAHHQDDQLETVLLQLLRGSGLRGVAGMQRIGPVGVDRHLHPDLLLCRPLLNTTKRELLDYAQQHQLGFVNDPSNSNTHLRRNWVRAELLPQIEMHFPQGPKALLRLAEFFQAHYQSEDAESARLIDPLIDGGALKLPEWRGLDAENRSACLRLWLLDQGVRCGRAKLLELERQLLINKGGMRQVAQGWHVEVREKKAHLITLKTKDSACE